MTDGGDRPRWLAVGIGNPDRQDDGVGPAIARRVGALGLPAAECPTPLEILDRLDAGLDGVIVADAVTAGAAAGTVHIRDLGRQPLPDGWVAGTHDFGLAATLELAANLGRLPAHVVMVGVEAAGFTLGTPMSPAVRAAIDQATGVVARLLRAEGSAADVPG
ncbi:MAG TPA: hydrogenase maturation protease [Mycobacteriales bacterium]|nr:hydrogenase maturation protease [Mycobacteriales bacterium]